jgi:predicted nucleic-acid-binding protein
VIGLDTNILVRFFAQDEPTQSVGATNLIASLSTEDRGYITLVAVTELVWVMQGSYNKTKEETIALLEKLLSTKELLLENAEVIWDAIRSYDGSQADFPDCLIERSAYRAGCKHTATFDGKAARSAGMVLLDS